MQFNNFETAKPKSSGKVMIPTSEALSSIVLETLGHISKMVGATLGPGGRQVLIERQEMNTMPIVTKDGVTVCNSLGYTDPLRQLILESARNAAKSTASAAGDGTTTATILSYSIAAATAKIAGENPGCSPQMIVRAIQAMVPVIEAEINKYKILVDGKNYEQILLRVATLSANGEAELAKAVVEALDVVGEEGNLTIVEAHGSSHYEVERVNGYGFEKGYEEGLRNFTNLFINDKSGTMVTLNNPVVLLYDGHVNDFGQIFNACQAIGHVFEENGRPDRGVIVVAHAFSDAVIADLSMNWNHPSSTAKILPVLSFVTAASSGTDFLYDLQAYTGSPVFNPITRSLADIDAGALVKDNRVIYFEQGRFRSTVVAKEDSLTVDLRVGELKAQLAKAPSQYEAYNLNVRIGKLTSGVARLKIYGSSVAETREKKDRAEDAWMSIKSAISTGAVPGGGFILAKLSVFFREQKSDLLIAKLAYKILAEALKDPVLMIYTNYGVSEEDAQKQLTKIEASDKPFDILSGAWVEKYELLDSAAAVVEAIKNSISIATLLGTLGGIVAFPRDRAADANETRYAREYMAAVEEGSK